MAQYKRIVYFVGAGPGDPKLITVRGKEVIQQADVILFDRLVNRELLQYAGPHTRFIDCGKKPGYSSYSQTKIHQLLVHHAKSGQSVVRLKGGDPGIFGRAGEEAAYCAQNGIPFEFVPGVTSGTAAPLYAGIPLTHRGTSSSVAFVTGHSCKGEYGGRDWIGLLKQVETVVVYMGMSHLPIIRKQMILQGCPITTPAAVIHRGTWEGYQKTLTGTLENIVDKVRQENIQSPAVIVFGEVVHLQKQLAWFPLEQHDSAKEEILAQTKV
ncbi:uroporphyrinogen-III C-methyltransferase [Melghirimyces algeriensis]|uniref:Uroporphyrinogen-III C-methyltransferase n=1 Tax=Melghirimyces algeriensis TaxID=910412 RepID=A0A521BV96_9BACL|nr:uroporphyrinogen-III C-methyltransferase [Melghirimyces algeriensis]SMO51124.1 uroporphyrinogen-III C-methyltransferase [Melghirimyces algeriensis]